MSCSNPPCKASRWQDSGERPRIASTSVYGIEPDTFNTVNFKPVTTSEVRLDVQTQDELRRWAMGIYEWQIK